MLQQQQAKALGDPTRHRLFRYLCDAAHAVGVAELTDYLGLNHNAVRQHLAMLEDAGLVVRDQEPRRRPGRPRLLYRLAPEAAGEMGDQGPYVYLAGLLGEVLRGGDPREVGQAAGRRAAGKTSTGVDPVDALEDHVARQGFRPRRVSVGTGTAFVLDRCPFELAAAASSATVCRLHLGLAEGLAAGYGDLEVIELMPGDPHRAGCRLAVRPCADRARNRTPRRVTPR